MQTLFALLYLTSNAAVLSMAVSGSIVPSALLADPVILPPSSYVSLSAPGSHYTAPLTQYGKFEIGNVDVDSYLLTVHCPTHVFRPLRVDVQQALVVVHTTIRGNEWDHIGPVEPFPILLQAVSRADYFTPREGFSLMSLVGNPMLLMAVFMSLMIYVIPKMTENIDPQAVKEMNERQNKIGNSMNFDAAGFLAGRSNPRK